MCDVLAEVALLMTIHEDLRIVNPAELAVVTKYLEDPTTTLEKFSCILHMPLAQQRSLEIVVPEDYPKQSPLISVRGVEQRNQHESLNRLISNFVESCIRDEPILDEVIQLVRDWNNQNVTQGQKQLDMTSSEHKNTRSHRRILFWAHHLLATSKRKDIRDSSKELGLRTILRRGYPGFIASEGVSEDIEELIKRIKSMRWAALALRYDETRVYDDTAQNRPIETVLQETFEETDDLSRFCGALQSDEIWKQSVMH